MESTVGWAVREINSLGVQKWLRLKVATWRMKALSKGAPVALPTYRGLVYARAHTSDIDVYYQIFITREYRCLDHVSSAELVIDCGANVGYSTVYFLERYPLAQVIAVEPDADNFAMLQRNTEPFRHRVTLIKGGVWSKSAGLVISNPDADSWSFSVREARPGESATVEAVDIPSLISQSGFDRVSILKVDIEGSEAEVFKHAPWLQKVDRLVIELHGQACEDAVVGAVNGRAAPSRCEELTVFDFFRT